jgi:hypothetical protein
MIHESIDHIPCCQVHPNHFNGSDYSSHFVLIHAFPCHYSEVFIGAVVSVPVDYLLARGEVSTVLIVARYDLEGRVGAQRCNLASEGRPLELNQGV